MPIMGLRKAFAVVVLGAAIGGALPAMAGTVTETTLAGADAPGLIAALKANAGIEGDIVLGLKARERLAALGRRDAEAVVPLIVEELKAPRAATRKAQQQRIALIGVLQDMGPAAEAAVPVLAAIAQDPRERNAWVKTQAAAALAAIGTPSAEAANQAGARRTAETWAESANDAQARNSAAENAYLIRQELRGRRPHEAVIAASLVNLRALGPRAEAAAPTLLRAYGDARLGSGLRAQVAETLTALGIADVPKAAAEAAQAAGEPDPIGEAIEDTRSPFPLVSSLAMGELGRMGPSDRAIDALIEALAAGRNPGAAALELGKFGAAAARAVPALLAYLDDDTAGPNAIQAVGRIGRPEPAAVAALRRIVARDGSRQRGMAAGALAELHATEAVPDLAAALSDRRKYTRILVANALGALGPEAAEAVPPLARLLLDEDTDVRRSATEALGGIGPAAEEAAPLIARQLDSPDSRLKESAAQALERIGGAPATAALARDARRYAAADRADYRRLRETDGAQQLHRYLEDLPAARRLQLAKEVARDPDPEIAVLAAWTYVEAGRTVEAVPVLADIVATSDRGAEILAAFGPATRGADGPGALSRILSSVTEYLNTNIETYSPEQRARIRRTLEAIGTRAE